MKHYEFGWTSPAGKEIYAQGWLPEKSKPKAVVLLIHGLGEHSSRYAHLAEFLCAKGIALLANDRIGHGKSKGARGHVPKYTQLLDDIVKLHSEATRKFGSIPVFLYGHSMGGGLVLNYLLRNSKNGLQGAIATSSALELAFEPPAFKVFLGKLMRGIYPAFSQTNELNSAHISRDPEVVKAYENDPLIHDKISAETGMGMLSWGKEAIAKAHQLQTPLLIMHGTGDQITSAEGSRKFAEAAKNADVTLKLWDGLYHEMQNEPEKTAVFDYIYDWIQSKLK